mmetsp:Transcript_29456/g.60764  ORF Transcript_29456/g.60764 Transcript_29456/m.60764 type:complete len:129 (-) Transcript_29456:820-1206(-)
MASIGISFILFQETQVVQSNERIATVHKFAAFSSAEFGTDLDAASIRNMNIAEAAAAAMLQRSPALIAKFNPLSSNSPATASAELLALLSSDSNAVPPNATKADIHVLLRMDLPKIKKLMKGTSLTLR